jgi:hypothetical protein
MRRIVLFFTLALGLSAVARADIMLTLNAGPVVSFSNFTWTYTATLKSGSTLNNGDFFTIYDIGGFGPGVPIASPVIMPGSNWSSLIQLVGINGFNQAPPDSGALYNLTFIFTGSSPVIAASDTILGGGAGTFGYASSSNTAFAGAFSATSHATVGGLSQGNTSGVTVAGPSTVPEPTTTLLTGCGLLALSFLRRRQTCADGKR